MQAGDRLSQAGLLLVPGINHQQYPDRKVAVLLFLGQPPLKNEISNYNLFFIPVVLRTEA